MDLNSPTYLLHKWISLMLALFKLQMQEGNPMTLLLKLLLFGSCSSPTNPSFLEFVGILKGMNWNCQAKPKGNLRQIQMVTTLHEIPNPLVENWEIRQQVYVM